MSIPARLYGVASLLLCAGAGVALLPPATGQSVSNQAAPDRVTTDTPAYCLQLLDRVSELVRALPSPPQEVTSLSTEGQRMCDQGQTRGGIMRLRRALVLLRQQAAGP
jgi:hypothetical protein